VRVTENESAGPLQFQVEDGVLWITLNNPPHNLMDSTFFSAFVRCRLWESATPRIASSRMPWAAPK